MREIGQTLARRMANLERQQSRLEIQPVPYIGDWYEYGEPLEYVDPNTIGIINTNVDLTQLFSIGDPIRLKQGGNYKYFYVFGVNPNQLSITAGTDFTLANATITDFARGLKPNPTGFPGVFNFEPNVRPAGGSGTVTGTEVNILSISNKICRIEMSLTFGTITVMDAIVFDLPVPIKDVGVDQISVQWVTNGILRLGYLDLGGSVQFDCELYVADPGVGIGPFGTSPGAIGYTLVFSYEIED